MSRFNAIRRARAGAESPAGLWRTTAIILLALLASAHAAWAAREFLMPLALAVIFAVMLSPVVRRVERIGAPPALASGLVIGLVVAALVALGVWLLPEATRLAEGLPKLLARLEAELRTLKAALAPISAASEEVRQSVAELGAGADPSRAVIVEGAGSPLTLAMTTASAIAIQTIFCVVLTFFLLSQRRKVRSVSMHIAGSNATRRRLAAMFADVKTRVSRYLLAVTLINIGLGVTAGLVLAALGFPGPALWGLLVAVSNFVPYAGPVAVQAAILVFGAADLGIAGAIAPAIAIWLLNTIEGHFLTPWLVGRQVVLNPLAVFLAVAFGGWTWGIAGAIVAVPVLIVTASALQHWWPVWATQAAPPEPTREILRRLPPLGTVFGVPR